MCNAPLSLSYGLEIGQQCLHQVTCSDFNLFPLMVKRLLGKKDFRSFVFAQTVPFLVLLEEVGSMVWIA